jgi:hypothetical protein
MLAMRYIQIIAILPLLEEVMIFIFVMILIKIILVLAIWDILIQKD